MTSRVANRRVPSRTVLLPAVGALLALCVPQADMAQAASLLSPKGSTTGSPVEFSWARGQGETQFLWRILQGGVALDATKRVADAFGCDNGTTCRWQASLSEGSYQWQVRPFSGNTALSWTGAASFTVGSGGSSDPDGSGGSSEPAPAPEPSTGSETSGSDADVHTQAEFNDAVKSGNKTIIVADGTYGFPKITESGLVIQAANRGKALITNRAMIEDASDVTIEGFKFISTSAFDAILCAKRCHNALIRRNIIESKNADYGIRVHRSKNVRIWGNVITGAFNHAISAKNQVFGLQINNNSFTDCGLLCIEASQQTDGTDYLEETSDDILIVNNQFIGESTGHGLTQSRGIRLGNAKKVIVRNNTFTGYWKYPVESNFSVLSAVPKQGKIGHFGSNHPTTALVEKNEFSGGTLDLAGRGRANDTITVRDNTGDAKCVVRNFDTRTSTSKKYVDWSTVYDGRPKVVSSGNSFGNCS